MLSEALQMVELPAACRWLIITYNTIYIIIWSPLPRCSRLNYSYHQPHLTVKETGFNKSQEITKHAGKESEMEMSLALLRRKLQRNWRSLVRAGQPRPAWEWILSTGHQGHIWCPRGARGQSDSGRLSGMWGRLSFSHSDCKRKA